MLKIQIDHKLNFHLHIDKIYQPASNQFNALIRLAKNERKTLADSFIYSNINYCPFI